MIVVGVLLGYAIQFFVAIQIMLPSVKKLFEVSKNQPFLVEAIFRTIMVLATFLLAELFPNLGLLISLLGSVCLTILALVFPPVIEFILLSNDPHGLSCWVVVKNSIILTISLVGFLTGSYVSLSDIIKTF